MKPRLGVGIVAAGPAVQAIHLPTLARLTDLFAVRHIMDVDAALAASVAEGVGARSSSSLSELLHDPDVEVVAVCSPSKLHAAQVTAAMEAGKKAVLCEKPLATTTEEAEAIARASAETGVPLLVGAMHTFDPAWTAVRASWDALQAAARTLRSSIVLPPNDRFEDWASEVTSRRRVPPPSEMTPTRRAGMLRGAVLGIVVHDLPLVRAFLPDPTDLTIDFATLHPAGYVITGHDGEHTVHLTGGSHAHWRPYWEFDAIADDLWLHIDFSPPYVHAGSAVATLTHPDGTSRVFGPFAHNGYEGEWAALHAAATGESNATPSADALIADLRFALHVADAASAHVLKEG